MSRLASTSNNTHQIPLPGDGPALDSFDFGFIPGFTDLDTEITGAVPNFFNPFLGLGSESVSLLCSSKITLHSIN